MIPLAGCWSSDKSTFSFVKQRYLLKKGKDVMYSGFKEVNRVALILLRSGELYRLKNMTHHVAFSLYLFAHIHKWHWSCMRQYSPLNIFSFDIEGYSEKIMCVVRNFSASYWNIYRQNCPFWWIQRQDYFYIAIVNNNYRPNNLWSS